MAENAFAVTPSWAKRHFTAMRFAARLGDRYLRERARGFTNPDCLARLLIWTALQRPYRTRQEREICGRVYERLADSTVGCHCALCDE